MKRALDPFHGELAARELADALRLSAAGGAVYWRAREDGTRAIAALARALGIDERGVAVIESLAMAADEMSDDFEAGLADGRIIDEQTMKIALACGERPYDCERDVRPTELP